MKKPSEEDIKEEDITEKADFEIDKDAFKGPFSCCNKKTKKIKKKLSIRGMDFDYEAWYCDKCKKEFLDSEQAERLEKLWIIEKLLKDDLITVERNMNFDGKTFFFRFPMEFTKKWNKGGHVDIKLLTPDKYLIEIKA